MGIISGTFGDDVLDGTLGIDRILARAGDDRVLAGGGDDVVEAGRGDDWVEGGNGADLLRGGRGSDTVFGAAGAWASDGGVDTLFGGDGSDALIAGLGPSVLRGGRGDDVVFGGAAADVLHGGQGHDWMFGGPGDDILRGGPGADTLEGEAGSDTVFGGDGPDLIVHIGHGEVDAPRWADRVDGGAGHDGVQLELPRADWLSPGMQAQVVNWIRHVDAVATAPYAELAPGSDPGFDFDLPAGTLRLSHVERLSPTALDGRPIDAAPVPLALDLEARVVEGGRPFGHTDFGVWSLLDLDASDSHAAAVTALETPGAGRLEAHAVFGPSGIDVRVEWVYFADAAALKTLGPGETLTDRFELTVTDTQGRSFSATVEAVIEGTHDDREPAGTLLLAGAHHGDAVGRDIAPAGDVNGDGFDDVVVGAPYASALDGERFLGRPGGAYVVYGGTGVDPGRIDLAALAPDQGFVIQPPPVGAHGGFEWAGWGRSVAAGDVNGDGFDDVLIGGPRHLDDRGGVTLIRGQEAPAGALVAGRWVVVPDAAPAWIGDAGTRLGEALASGFDFNGDGFDDVLAGAPGTEPLPGRDDLPVLPGEAVLRLGGADGLGARLVLHGDAPGEATGFRVAAAGDVNGDGFDDLLVGSPGAVGGGRVTLWWGHGEPVDGDRISAGAPPASHGTVIVGGDGWNLGFALSAAGDFNGDGLDDFAVRAATPDDAGRVFVVFGSPAGIGAAVGDQRVLDLARFTAADGVVIEGSAGARLGARVAAAGDVDGDGAEDLLLSTGSFHGPSDDSGAVLVFGGHPGADRGDGVRRIDMAILTDAERFVFEAPTPGEAFAERLAGIGDVDGDGLADVGIGARDADAPEFGAGAARIWFGATIAASRPVDDVAEGHFQWHPVGGDGWWIS